MGYFLSYMPMIAQSGANKGKTHGYQDQFTQFSIFHLGNVYFGSMNALSVCWLKRAEKSDWKQSLATG